MKKQIAQQRRMRSNGGEKIMKRILNVAVLPLALIIGLLYMSTSAEALPIAISSIGDAKIIFTGTGDTITFQNSTTAGAPHDFHIGSVDNRDPDSTGFNSGNGLFGNIDGGPFTIGSIHLLWCWSRHGPREWNWVFFPLLTRTVPYCQGV